MKLNQELITYAICYLIIFFVNDKSFSQSKSFIVEHENQIAKKEPAPHNGVGTTTAYSFFNNDTTNLVFRKRVLHSGSEIGYHLQEKMKSIIYLAVKVK